MPNSTRSLLTRSAVALATFVIACVLGAPGVARAHNSLLSSDPADGAVLEVAPAAITWVFDQPVPLETMTVTLVDPSGARTDLAGSTHGPSGDTEVVTPLPALPAGEHSIRWRLVGPDGHPITGRVELTVAAPAAAPATTAPTPAAGVPATSTPTPAVTTPVPDDALDADDGAAEEAAGTSGTGRWLLRYGSYVAIMAAVGIVLTAAWVWPAVTSHPTVRRALSASLAATVVLAFLQLLVLASDVGGTSLLSSFDRIDAATTTDAGMAYGLRVVLAAALWVVLFGYGSARRDVYWTAVSMAGIGLLATWAFAGHARSMRWPAVGVVTDVAHHAAAAAWLAGLAVVGMLVVPRTEGSTVAAVLPRFSRVAAIAVGVLVVTGLVHAVRLVGSPGALLDATHGRYLVAKVVALAAMLAVADVNRRRVRRLAGDDDAAAANGRALRTGVAAELAIGLAVVAITASMVVSPPAASAASTAAPTPVNYTM